MATGNRSKGGGGDRFWADLEGMVFKIQDDAGKVGCGGAPWVWLEQLSRKWLTIDSFNKNLVFWYWKDGLPEYDIDFQNLPKNLGMEIHVYNPYARKVETGWSLELYGKSGWPSQWALGLMGDSVSKSQRGLRKCLIMWFTSMKTGVRISAPV